MIKRIFIILFFLTLPFCINAGLESVNGMILLQVEKNGEAWYVYPKEFKRYYLGRPEDAFFIMRELGLGVKHDELNDYLEHGFPESLSGMIMLDVEKNGEAYYVYPKDLKGYYLGRPQDAFNIMSGKGLGITDYNLYRIALGRDIIIGEEVIEEGIIDETEVINYQYYDTEREIFDIVNDHRESIGEERLIWSSEAVLVARAHSIDMAEGRVEPGHDGFYGRMDEIQILIEDVSGLGENIAWNNSPDPAGTSLKWWLQSESHKNTLEKSEYELSGVGAALGTDNIYYITQLFVSLW